MRSGAARSAEPGAADRSGARARTDRGVRSWPLLVLAAAEVRSGWVGIAQKTGFGLVRPLPGIWPSLHLETSITLPIGVEASPAFRGDDHVTGGRFASASPGPMSTAKLAGKAGAGR
jgi:hypothetical protein